MLCKFSRLCFGLPLFLGLIFFNQFVDSINNEHQGLTVDILERFNRSTVQNDAGVLAFAQRQGRANGRRNYQMGEEAAESVSASTCLHGRPVAFPSR